MPSEPAAYKPNSPESFCPRCHLAWKHADHSRCDEPTEYEERIGKALDMIARDGSFDGGHHKQWVLDQVARILCGPDPRAYEAWCPEDWDEGIPP
jgi:hypothetical protein